MEISKNDFKVSTFKNYTEVNVPYHCDAKSLLERFKTDVNEIHKNRGFNKSDFDKFKKTLPIACFGGLFAKRSKNNLVKASGLMVLDFDDVKNIEEKKNELKSYDYIYSVFTSPSGKGIKALARIPIVKNDKEYKNYYRGIQKEIRGLDESGKDISRACFFSYDPEVYINEEVREFTKQLHEKTKILSKSVLEKNDYQIAGKVLRIIQYANVGERHTKVLSASRLMGGYVEAKKISYDEAVRLLEQEAYNIDPEDFQTNKKAIYDGLEDGMKNPLSNLDLDK